MIVFIYTIWTTTNNCLDISCHKIQLCIIHFTSFFDNNNNNIYLYVVIIITYKFILLRLCVCVVIVLICCRGPGTRGREHCSGHSPVGTRGLIVPSDRDTAHRAASVLAVRTALDCVKRTSSHVNNKHNNNGCK